ncbi:MAG: hypothetical protein AB7F89_19210 [Pirellulaceae bacterium]
MYQGSALLRTLGAALCLSLIVVAVGQAQESAVNWQRHPWARFGAGSWKKVRVHNESLNDKGEVESTSVTDTTTTLVEVSPIEYTLRIDVEVEVAGRRFVVAPKVLTQGYNGESKSSGQTVELKTVGPGEVEINGRKYPVEIRKVTINGDELKRVSYLHYSQDVAPHVLRRETKATEAETGRPKYETSVDVTAVEMPFRVLSETKLASHMKTIQRKADGASTVTLEVYCDDVPGGLVESSTKEMNAEGRVITQSILELVEYQVVPVPSADTASATSSTRRRLFHRSRLRNEPGRSVNR